MLERNKSSNISFITSQFTIIRVIVVLDDTVGNSNWCFYNLYGSRLPLWKQSDKFFDDDYRRECRNVPQCQQQSY